MSLPAIEEIDAFLEKTNENNDELDDWIKQLIGAPQPTNTQTHEPDTDPYYTQSFSWNRLHEEKAVKIQSAYRLHRSKKNDQLNIPIPVCEYKKCGNLLVFGQSRFCDNSCARRFAVSSRWSAESDKENVSTPPTKKQKRCGLCGVFGHNKTTCKTVEKPLADVTNQLATLQAENQELKACVLWYQQVMQNNMIHVNQQQ